jgi:hypothetical protein
VAGASSCPACVVAPVTTGGDSTLSSVMVRASYLFMPED